MMKNPYNYFEKFIVRFSIYPTEHVFNLLKEFQNDVIGIYESDEYFRNAVLLASPDLYFQLKELAKLPLTTKSNRRINLSLMKYLTRMGTRSTPYGLFAGISFGRAGVESNITIDRNHIKTIYQYDNTFLLEQSNKLLDTHFGDFLNTEVASNNLIVKIGNKYKYAESSDNFLDGTRSFKLVSTVQNEHIDRIIQISKLGVTIKKLVDDLHLQGIEMRECFQYLKTLIENHILITELEPFTGCEYLNQLVHVSKKNESNDLLKTKLTEYASLLSDINNDGLSEVKFKKTFDIRDSYFSDPLKNKMPLKATPVLVHETNSIDKGTLMTLRNLLPFFNRITGNYQNANIQKFIEAFYERYEFREVGLMDALNSDFGVGYPIGSHPPSVNPLEQGVNFVKKPNGIDPINWSVFLGRIHNRIVEAYRGNESVISLEDREFSDFEQNWDGVPATLYGIAKIIKIDGTEKVVIGGFSGPSAMNLITRFANHSVDIRTFLEEIADKEKEQSREVVIAQIVHNPNSHLSNVFEQPVFFGYYIPILSPMLSEESITITLEELTIKLNHKMKIELRSKKLNKRIRPLLINPHNTGKSEISVYRFLADLSTHANKSYVGFKINELKRLFKYIPRIEYKNCILFEARWFIDYKNSVFANAEDANDEKLLSMASQLRISNNIPRLILICNWDQELLIDFENALSIRIFVHELSKHKVLEIKEFLFANESLVKDSDNRSHCHELIFTLYRNAEASN